MPPTITQQRGFAYAPIPFAVISFFSSSYVIHYLLYKDRQKLKRLYHRLVLAMNFALLPLTSTYIWSTFAVPAGTPNYVGASGTINTCTAQGFIFQMLAMTVPTYYASLSIQAFMGLRYKFREEKYQWIEKFIHLVAWCFPAALATIAAVTDNYNPNGSGCAMTKAPLGCEADKDVPCERGGNIDMVEYIVGLSIAFLYFILPPSVIISTYCWIKSTRKSVRRSGGMHQIREQARGEMMRRIAIQMSLYLFSFWFTFAPTLIAFVDQILTGDLFYDLLIFANCVFALQGFVMAIVYFGLQRLGTPKVEGVPTCSRDDHITVRDIRANAKKKTESGSEVDESRRESYVFNIFDGVPDEDSPWARYFDQDDDYSVDANAPGADRCALSDDIEETPAN